MRADTWFIYALGSGWGHLNRALALAQTAANHRSIHLLVNSPYAARLAPIVQATQSQSNLLTLHLLPRTASLSAAKRAVQAILTAVEYDCLIVDTFPRGLVGDLADLLPKLPAHCRVLVHRDLTPDYIEAKGVSAFVRQHYDGILIPGEIDVPFLDLPQAKLTAPWLSRNAADLIAKPLPHWKISTQQHLAIVCAAGQPHELDFFGRIANQLSATRPDLAVRCLSAICPNTCPPKLWISHWPGLDVLQFADVVIGSGGYNLVHECAALDVPLIAFALPRRYDRQARRIRYFGQIVSSLEEAIAAVNSLTHLQASRKSAEARSIDYSNGVTDAIAHIEAWSRKKRRVQ